MFLLLIAISVPSSEGNSISVTDGEEDQEEIVPSLPQADKLQYSLLAPPMAFHKRFRHSIYNVICTDCGECFGILAL